MRDREIRSLLMKVLKKQTSIMPTFIGGLDVINFYLPEQRKKVIDALMKTIGEIR